MGKDNNGIRHARQGLASEILDGAIGAKKRSCPKCGENSFSATADGNFGQCWRPSCGFRLHRFSDESFSAAALLHRALQPIYDLFHKTLLEDDAGRSAREYLSERTVHPFISRHAAIGAVPANFDPTPLFEEPIRLAQENFDKLKAKRKAKSQQKQLEYAEHVIEILVEAREKLPKCGWFGNLAFFYTDDQRRFIGIHFRKPFTREFSQFQPIKRRGVFGLNLWHHEVIPSTRLIIVEGEFNSLSLQSLMVRLRETEGRELETGLLCCCAVGSCTDIDVRSIAGIARNSHHPPLVIYDSDDSNAGYGVVEQLCSVRDCDAACTNTPNKDIDELIRSFGSDNSNAVAAVHELFAQRQRLAFRVNESPDDPHRLARLFLDQRYQCDGITALRLFRDEFLKWECGSYRAVPDKAVRAYLTAHVKEEFNRVASERAQKE